MNQVELIRRRVVSGQFSELRKLIGFISMTDGNVDVLDRLREKSVYEPLLAQIVDAIMLACGHVEMPPEKYESQSHASRAVSKAARTR